MEFELQGVERIPAYAGMNGASFPFSESITETIEETGPYNVFVTKIVDLHDPFRALNSEIIFTANQYIGSLSLYFNKKRFSVHPPNFLNKVGKGRYDIIPQSNVLRVLEEGVPMYRIGLDFKSGIIDINVSNANTGV
ncbi:MAG: hypothetical protein ACMXYE_03285 [Candidatus Woesearchaeota archaeon]